MNRTVKTMLPAAALTVVSMVLTLAVVVMWLGASMPVGVALVVGLGLDGGWPATLPTNGVWPRRATTTGW